MSGYSTMLSAMLGAMLAKLSPQPDNGSDPVEVVNDVDEALARLCEVPHDRADGQLAQVSPGHISRLSHTLQRQDAAEGRLASKRWSERARLYWILRGLDSAHLMPSFVESGLTDIALPMNDQSLPTFVKGRELRRKFLRSQRHVLTTAHSIERPDPKTQQLLHAHLEESPDQYFMRIADLGNGAYGQVDKVRSVLSQKLYARKTSVRGKDSPVSRHRLAASETEILTLKKLRHQHLVQVAGSYTTDDQIAFLMLPIAEMNLEQWLDGLPSSAKGPPSPDHVSTKYFFGCLAGAMCYLRTNNIRHRDLKPRNVLIQQGRLYVADFGSAFDFSDTGRSKSYSYRVAGTEDFWSPEHVKGSQRTYKSEMWALGLLFLHINSSLVGRSPAKWQQFLAKKARAAGTDYVAHSNLPAITEWLEKLANIAGNRDVTEPIGWARDLLQLNPDARPSPGSLRATIADSPFSQDFLCPDCRLHGHSGSAWLNTTDPNLAEEARSLSVAAARNRQAERKKLAAITSSWERPVSPPPSKASSSVEQWLQLSTSSLAGKIQGPPGTPPELVSDSTRDPTEHHGFLTPPRMPGSFDYRGTFDSEAQIYVQNSDSSSAHGTDAGGVMVSEPDEDGDSVQSQEIGSEPIIHVVEDHGSETSDVSFGDPKELVSCGDDPFGLQVIQEDGEDDVLVTWNEPQAAALLQGRQTIPGSPWLGVQDDNMQAPNLISGQGLPLIAKHTSATWTDVQPRSEPRPETLPHRPQVTHSTPRLQGIKSTTVGKTKSRATSIDQYAKITVSYDTSPSKAGIPLGPVSVDDAPTTKDRNWPALDAQSLAGTTMRTKVNSFRGSVRRRKTQSELNSTIANLRRLFRQASRSPQGSQKLSAANLAALSRRQSNGLTRSTIDLSMESNPDQDDDTAMLPDTRLGGLLKSAWMDLDTESVATTTLDDGMRKKLSFSPWYDKQYQVLERYCKAGLAGNVKYILGRNCNPGTAHDPRPLPLVVAIKGKKQGHYKCVKALITAGCDVSAKSSQTTPLLRLMQQSPYSTRDRLLARLLDAGANTNQAGGDGHVPIIKVFTDSLDAPLEAHKLDILARLLHPAVPIVPNINAKQPTTGNTALHLAIRRRSPLAVGLLLLCGADVNATNSSGVSPLLIAANQWEGEIDDDQSMTLEYLLNDDAININAKAGTRMATALHQAARAGSTLAVEMLLDNGADLGSTDNAGCTARAWLHEYHPKTEKELYTQMNELLPVDHSHGFGGMPGGFPGANGAPAS